jgi:hypothetical protein
VGPGERHRRDGLASRPTLLGEIIEDINTRPCNRPEVEHVRRFVAYVKMSVDKKSWYPPVNANRYLVALDQVPSIEQIETQPEVKVKFSEATTVREESDDTVTKYNFHLDYINCREALGAVPKVMLIHDPLAGIENFRVSG